MREKNKRQSVLPEAPCEAVPRAQNNYDPYDSALQEEKAPSVSPWKRSIGTLNQNFPASALIGNTKFYT
jgi:hypothetical protein